MIVTREQIANAQPRPRKRAPGFNMVHSSIQGIPCLIDVNHYRAGEPADYGHHNRRTAALVDPGQPGEDAEAEFDVYDRRGYRARWLERKMTDQDERKILADIEGHMDAAMAGALTEVLR